MSNFDKLGDTAAKAGRALRDGFRRGGVAGVLSGVGESVGELASGLGELGTVARGAATTGLRAVAGAAGVALDGLKAAAAGAGALGVALAGIGAKGVAEFATFEQGFNQVRTLIEDSQVDVAALENGVRDLATTFGVDLREATQAAYQAISAGVEPARVVEFLGTSFQGAAAGAADVARVTDLVTSALNAFGKPVSEAQEVSDRFFATVRLGKTTIDELSQSFGQVAPIAASAGVSLEEVNASFATLTASGLSTAEAATQIRAVISGIVKPAGAAGDALKQVGIDAGVLREQGLEKVFQILQKETGGATEELARFLPNVRALGGAATLAGSGFERFNRNLREVRDSAGATQTAFEKVAGQLTTSFGRLRTAVTDALASIGQALAPAIGAATDQVSGFLREVGQDLRALAAVVTQRFAPETTDALRSVGDEAEGVGSVVQGALDLVSDALNKAGVAATELAEPIGVAIGAFRGLGELIAGTARVIQVNAGNAFIFLSRAVGVGISALRAFAEAVGAEGIGKDLREAEALLTTFTNELELRTDLAAKAAKKNFDSIFEEGSRAAAESEASLKRFGAALRNAGKEAASLGDQVVEQRRKQEEAAKATREQAKAADEARKAQERARQETQRRTEEQQKLNAALGQTLPTARQLFAQTNQNADALNRTADAARGAARGLREVGTAARDAAVPVQQLRAAFDVFNDEVAAATAGAGRASPFDRLTISARDLSKGVREAFDAIDNTLRGRFRESSEFLLAEFARGERSSRSFTQAVQELGQIQLGFADPGVFEQFIQATGQATLRIGSFKGTALDALQTVSNVLTGEFRASADVLIRKFGEGAISSREFKREVDALAAGQLGFDQIFQGLDGLGARLRVATQEADKARGALGTELRQAVEESRQQFQAGQISLDQYLDALQRTGQRVRDFKGLTEDQLVAVSKLRSENDTLADRVLDLSRNLDRSLLPALGDFLKAFRSGALNANQLSVALGRLTKQQRDLAAASRDTAAAIGENAGAFEILDAGLTNAAVIQAEFFEQLRQGQQAIDATNAATQRYRTEGVDKLLPKIEELRQRTNEAGRAQVDRLVRGFESAAISGAQLRQELQRVADATVNLGRAAQQAGQQVQQAFAGSNRLGAFGQPGQIQFQRRGGGGASLLGLQGRVTGSANFTSPLEQQVGQSLGLGPKALRSRAQRSGGLLSLARQLGFDVDRFAAGGPIDSTGPLIGEAGEFMLNQRGLSDLGRILAKLLNQGGGGGVNQTFNNSFQLTTAPEAQSDMRRLAFELTPELRRVGQLAAARSPVS